MVLFVRSWNVFHGNTSPPNRRSHLEAMVELVTADAPDVVCLQELPLWSLPMLQRWSGMTARSAVARRAWLPAWLGGPITRLNNGLFRSAISGQANAILLRQGLEPLEHRSTQISEGRRERRICHGVRLQGFVVANLHASGVSGHPEVASGEVSRADAFARDLAHHGDVVVVAGDFNLRGHDLPGPAIDHIVVHGADAGPLEVWPEARRVQNGRVLSDHAPVERRIG
jgi:endonuclease/exonuclease/phosphatase family metal-dependent hydrolase